MTRGNPQGNNEISPGRARGRQGGQVLPLLSLMMLFLFGFDALAIDFGMMYFHQNELNAATQAAALAGAEAMALPGATVTTTTTAVTTYSGVSGNDNAYANLPTVSMVSGYPLLKCLSTVTSLLGLQCYGPSSSNAIVVKEQETLPLLFLRLLHTNSVTLTSTATAAMRGALAGPFNVVIIVDSTHSMTDTDSDSQCNTTRISCALAGVRVLLQSLSPCQPSESTCGTVTSGMVSNSVDRVSLLTFPPVTTATVADDYNCGKSSPTTADYSTPFPSTQTYQVVGFSSDYRTSDTSTSLNTNSNIVVAVGGKSSCTALQAIGGAGTFYAQVIYAAQSYLAAEQSLFPNSQNVMILLSDGDATATCSTSSGGVCKTGDLPGASTTGTTYIATNQECHQAITAAQAAATAGTRVYAVAYGAEASGCASDTSPTITPCQTMQKIASSPGYFFSDYTATGGDSACISASQPTTNLNQIFTDIAVDLTVAKLIPNGTT